MIDFTVTHNSVAVNDGSNVDSSAMDLHNLPTESKLFFDLTVTGDGTATVQYLVGSSLTDTFIVPSGASNICSGHTKTSGTSGRDIYKLDDVPFFHQFMKVRVSASTNLVALGRLVKWSGGRL